MRVEFSGTDPSVTNRSFGPSTPPALSPLDEERRRQQAGMTDVVDGSGATVESTRVTLSSQGLALSTRSEDDTRQRSTTATEIASTRSPESSDTSSTTRANSNETAQARGPDNQPVSASVRAAQERLAAAGIRTSDG